MKTEVTFAKNDWQPRFVQNRWPEVRAWNVNQVKKLWDDEPDRVQVINDPRLGTTSLVMMRKDQFERMHNLISDLLDGQAGIESDLKVALEQVSLIEKIVIPSGDSESMLSALSVLKVLFSNSKRIFIADPSPVPPSPLTADELAALEKDDEL